MDSQENKKTLKSFGLTPKNIGISVIVLALVGCGVFFTSRPTPVNYKTLTQNTYEDKALASGLIVADEVISISGKAGGTVSQIMFKEGEQVEKGQVILTLDTVDLDQVVSEKSAALEVARSAYDSTITTQYNLAKEDVAKLELQLAQAKTNLSEINALYELGSASKTEVDLAQNKVKEIEISLKQSKLKMESYSPSGTEAKRLYSSINQANTSLKNSKEDYGNYKIVAPVSGTIVKSNIQEGESIQAGVAIMDIAKSGEKFGEIKIDEKSINTIKLGQKAYIYPSSRADLAIETKVIYISPFVDKESGTVEARVKIPTEAYDSFLLDMTVTVELVEEALTDAFVVDSSYVVQDPLGNHIFIEESGKAKELKVEVIGSGSLVAIKGDLQESMKILNPTDLKDGDKVKPMEGAE